MVSVNFKLAILTVLANWPDRRATIDEIRQEVGIIFANGGHADSLRRLSALGDIDIFQTGLVSRNEAGFQITDAGLSLLQSLESCSGPSPDVSTAPASQPFSLIDDLTGAEERLKIFDLELRTLDNIAVDGNGNDGNDNRDRQPGQVEANWVSEIEAPADHSLIGTNGLPERIDPETYEGNRATAKQSAPCPQDRARVRIHVSLGMDVDGTGVVPLILLPIPFPATALDLGIGVPIERVWFIAVGVGPGCAAREQDNRKSGGDNS
jgi:hypothetical protein